MSVLQCIRVLANSDSIQGLKEWFKEDNGYVCKTIEASIKAINEGGFENRIPYLPKYYNENHLNWNIFTIER